MRDNEDNNKNENSKVSEWWTQGRHGLPSSDLHLISWKGPGSLCSCVCVSAVGVFVDDGKDTALPVVVCEVAWKVGLTQTNSFEQRQMQNCFILVFP